MDNKYKITKLACYSTNVSMAVITNLPSILFITFRSLYSISYSLLGLLVLVNYSTQLAVDLLLSFFSHKINTKLAVRFTPIISLVGLLFYAISPFFLKSNIFLGLLIGTVIFSASGGLSEVLISPVIAAIPSKNPEREMSKLHSTYAWGVVIVIILGTLFLFGVGESNWQWIILAFTSIPLLASVLFIRAKIPELQSTEKVSGVSEFLKKKDMWICVFAIFLGGATECTMAQWSSSYIEQALGIPKVLGDIFGVALFGLMLALGRTLYSKYGKKITKVLLAGAIGAVVCYFTAAISPSPVLALIACALTGFCASMLWPGTLVVASERFPDGGVFIYAMMAAGGDFGASVGPQLVGIISDAALTNQSLIEIAQKFSITPEQLGMKLGMLIGMLFPLIAIFIYLYIMKKFTSKKEGKGELNESDNQY